MASAEIEIFFRNEEQEIEIGETLEVISLGHNLFRLEQTPLAGEDLNYGDVVELEHREGNSWVFVRVAEHSGWQHTLRLLTKSRIESEPFQLWLESIVERGGFWEVALGGVVIVSWPRDSTLDVKAELEDVLHYC